MLHSLTRPALATAALTAALTAPGFGAATLDERFTSASVSLRAEENGGPTGSQQDFLEGELVTTGTSQGYGSITTPLIDESLASQTNGWATASGTSQASSSFAGGDGSTTFDSFTVSDAVTLDLAVADDPPATFGNTVGRSAGTGHNVFFTITTPHDWTFLGSVATSESASGNFPSVSADDADWTFFLSEIGGSTQFFDDSDGPLSFFGTLDPGSYRVAFGTNAGPSGASASDFKNGSASFSSSLDGTFSLTNTIPEPASLALLVMVGGLCLLRRRR